MRLQLKAVGGVAAKAGDLITLTQACPVPALRGVLGQAYTANPDYPDRVRVQLILDTEHSTQGGIFANQRVSMANDVGLKSTEYVICPPAKRKTLMAACSTLNRHDNKGEGPYSLNAIFDTGSNTFMSSVVQLFSDLKPLGHSEMIEGLDGQFSEATHIGTVTMILGTHQRVFKEAFYCPVSVHTIVPGTLFDNDDYCFMGKNKAMHILLRDNDTEEVLVSYPRELTISEGTHYSSAFLADLGPKSLRGTGTYHIPYP